MATTAADTPVTLTYLGTAGWSIAQGSHTLLVDPYFTRVDVEDDDTVLLPNADAIARYTPPRADGILVGHAHYDHLLDVPSIAKRLDATVAGSEDALVVARAAGIPEKKLVVARGGSRFTVGGFEVRAIHGLHSITGKADGNVPSGAKLPMRARDYGTGETLDYVVRTAGASPREILFVGSANFVERELEGVHPDVAVIATALREKIPDYTCRLMRVLGRPKRVFANHFDAHWEPIGPKQLDLDAEGRASLARFADEVHACAPESTVIVPVHFRPQSI